MNTTRVMKNSKKKQSYWWENNRVRTCLLIIYSGIIPLLFVMKYILHLF